MTLYLKHGINKEKCERCGYSEFKELLCVHHIDENHSNEEDGNKIVLCYNCHDGLHHGLWVLSSIRPGTEHEYTPAGYIVSKHARVAQGLEFWKGRGPDKKKRSSDGYVKEQARRRALKAQSH